jgi:sugar/nucleoside kinase (ribokinase family)
MRDYDILVIGELNVDLILTGDDVVPAFGQAEKLVDDATLALGSSSAIFACGAGRLGLRVAFVGKIGDDDFGRFMLRTLASRGVDTGPVIVDPTVKTGLTLHLSRRTDRAMLTYLGSIAALRGDEVDRWLFQRTRHVHVGSFFLQTGVQPALAGLFAAAHAAGATVSLDPGWDPAGRWNGTLNRTLDHVDVFLPNGQEAMAITGATDVPEALDRLARRLPLTVVKLGPDGASARSGPLSPRFTPPSTGGASGVREVHCLGFRVAAIDTTGAGDSFNAGFLYGHLNGMELADSLRWGCACGALATTRVGGIEGQPRVDEVERLLFY